MGLGLNRLDSAAHRGLGFFSTATRLGPLAQVGTKFENSVIPRRTSEESAKPQDWLCP